MPPFHARRCGLRPDPVAQAARSTRMRPAIAPCTAESAQQPHSKVAQHQKPGRESAGSRTISAACQCLMRSRAPLEAAESSPPPARSRYHRPEVLADISWGGVSGGTGRPGGEPARGPASDPLAGRTAMATPRVERRLAAILAADVVGYSRLMERDEQGTLERLKAHRREFIDPLIAEYRGRDRQADGRRRPGRVRPRRRRGALRGVDPAGHGRAGAGLPEAERIRFRIGINLGDVIVEGDGDIYGDGVNVAARLESWPSRAGCASRARCARSSRASSTCRSSSPASSGSRTSSGRSRPGGWCRAACPVRRCARVRRLGRGPWRPRWRCSCWLPRPSVAGGGGRRARPQARRCRTSPRSRCCRSTTSPATRGSAGSPTAWWRTSSPTCPGFGVFVIARGTSFSYRDKPSDARSVGRELGVRYVVEGSLQGEGERLRATVNLVDATTAAKSGLSATTGRLRTCSRCRTSWRSGSPTRSAALSALRSRALLEEARGKPPQSLQVNEWCCWRSRGAGRHQGGQRESARAGPEGDRARSRISAGLTRSRLRLRRAGVGRLGTPRRGRGQVARDGDPGGRARAAQRLGQAEARAALRDGQRFRPLRDELDAAADVADGNAALMVEVASELPWAGQTARAVEMLERALRLDPASSEATDGPGVSVYFHARRFEEAAARPRPWGRGPQPDAVRQRHDLRPAGPAGRAGAVAIAPARGGSRTSRPNVYSTSSAITHPTAAAERALVLESVAKAGLPMCATPEQLAEETDMRRMPECEAERAKSGLPRT